MTLTIILPSDVEALLKARAQTAGKSVDEYVSQFITQELMTPLSFVEAAEGFARAVEAAGVSDDELATAVVKFRDMARQARRQRNS